LKITNYRHSRLAVIYISIALTASLSGCDDNDSDNSAPPNSTNGTAENISTVTFSDLSGELAPWQRGRGEGYGGMAWLDYDNDDDLDLMLTNERDYSNGLMRNNGDGTFTDVTIEANDESYTESDTITSGDEVVVVDTPFGKLGLAVCYDLRFPELFRAMADVGMEICALPSAFTSLTGNAHWESLLRARAIENLCFMIAAGQGGYHVNGRETHGDSMIVDPWGVILNRLPQGTGAVVSAIDMKQLGRTRELFPALHHKRLDCKINYS
jgi:hypothetical protein